MRNCFSFWTQLFSLLYGILKMKIVKNKYIKKKDFFNTNRLFECSKSEIENDWKLYLAQRKYINEQIKIRKEFNSFKKPTRFL